MPLPTRNFLWEYFNQDRLKVLAALQRLRDLPPTVGKPGHSLPLNRRYMAEALPPARRKTLYGLQTEVPRADTDRLALTTQPTAVPAGQHVMFQPQVCHGRGIFIRPLCALIESTPIRFICTTNRRELMFRRMAVKRGQT